MLDPKEILFGFSAKHIARLCEVDLTTARRWKRGAICPPQPMLALLHGDLGFFDPAWTGWRLHEGCLVSPESWRIYVNDVLAVPLLRHQLSAYQSENRSLKAALAHADMSALEEQPTVDQWDVRIVNE